MSAVTLRVMALKDRVRAEYDVEVDITDRLLAQIGTLPLDWRPHPRSRSLAELVAHLAEVPTWGSYILDRLEFDRATLPETPVCGSATEALLRFRDRATATQRLLDKSDAEWRAIWRLVDDSGSAFTMPRTTAFRRLVLSHLIHHRGQLSVYVRMSGAVVTTIYGASADDAWDYTPST